MVIEYPTYKTWFVKIDNGFNGHQTAIIRFKKGILGSAIRNIVRLLLFFILKYLFERIVVVENVIIDMSI